MRFLLLGVESDWNSLIRELEPDILHATTIDEIDGFPGDVDAILVDFDRPHADRMELDEVLRSQSRFAWTLIVGLTQHSTTVVPNGVEDSGIDELLFVTDESSLMQLRLAILRKRIDERRERKRLLAEVARTQALVDTAPDALISCNDAGRVIVANKRAHELFGYETELIVGREVEDLMPHRFRDRHVELRRDFFQNPRSRELDSSLDLTGLTSDGREFSVDIAVGWHDHGGERIATAAIRDITRQRALERQLLQTKLNLESAYERISDDVRAASSIQKALLPKSTRVHDFVHVDWAYEPCETLAGDGLGVFPIDEHHVAFYTSDVSGHGVKASLLAVMVANLVSTSVASSTMLRHARNDLSGFHLTAPDEVALELNRTFLEYPTRWQYFTFFYGLLDTRTGDLRYVTAGSPGFFVLHASGEVENVQRPGYPIGLIPDAEFQSHTHRLPADGRLLLCSDGVIEALDDEDRLFGFEGVRDHLARSRDDNLGELVHGLARRIKTRKSDGIDDDVSILALQLLPRNPS